MLRFSNEKSTHLRALETPAIVVFLDRSLERAVGVLLRLDHQIEPSGAAAVGDGFVALALPIGADPTVVVGLEPQMCSDSCDAAHVVERHKTMGAVCNDTAGFEDGTRSRRVEKVGELTLSHEPQYGMFRHGMIRITGSVVSGARTKSRCDFSQRLFT